MRGIIRQTPVLIVLGVMLNIVFAWACATWSPRVDRGEYLTDDVNRDWWNQHSPPGFSRNPFGVMYEGGFGVSSAFMWELKPNGQANTFGNNMLHLRAGWPMHSLECARWVDRRNSRTFDQHVAFTPDLWLHQSRLIPLRPIWPAFVINSLICALALVMLSFAFKRARRWMRLRRCLCPVCKYPYGSSQQCSECGASLRSINVA